MESHGRKIKIDGRTARVAICFFGIPRSLHLTRPSIEKNILNSINKIADTQVFCHFFDQKYIKNPRTGEFGEADQDDKICSDQVCLTEAPDECLKTWKYDELKPYGDFWGDGFIALRNLIHQLHSIHKVTDLSKEFCADCTVFVRPDQWYYDDLAPIVDRALRSNSNSVYVPYWQPFGGLNDRFAIVRSSALDAYANRVSKAEDFCKDCKSPLHSESLLKYSLKDKDVFPIACRAARVRSGGAIAEESFAMDWVERAHRFIVLSRLPRPFSSLVHRLLKSFQHLRDLKDGRKKIPKSSQGTLILKFPE